MKKRKFDDGKNAENGGAYDSEINTVNTDSGAPRSSTKAYFYTAAVCAVFGLASFILAVALPSVIGVYGLIAAVVFELASLSFLNTQKKKKNFKFVFYLTVAVYALLAFFIIFFILIFLIGGQR